MDHLSLARAAQVATGKQPRGKRVKPLVPEFKSFVTIQGPAQAMPPTDKLSSSFPVQTLLCKPAISSLPAGSRCIRKSRVQGESGKSECFEAEFGIPWQPKEFVSFALAQKHPKDLVQGLPQVLKDTIRFVAENNVATVAKERTACLRRWMIRAKELKQVDEPAMPDHCKEVLRGKPMHLFDEMLKESGYADADLVNQMCQGFDLLGRIPDSGVMPRKLTAASVREVADSNRLAVWQSTKACRDLDVAKEVYKATVEERGRGWLSGPIPFHDLPKGSILTRRFGVSQTSFDANLGQVSKIRPIDDFTESLANLTNYGNETTSSHGVDVIVASLCLRIRLERKLGRSPNLVSRTIDLRKAYKQLPISESALSDAFLCVYNPQRGEPEAFQTRVLPFGAKPAVQGFCRVSHALWWLGVRLLRLQWSVFFDDFVLNCLESERSHVDMIQAGLFALLGWETSSEKDAGFSSVARALGIEISLADSKLGLVRVQNTEGYRRALCIQIDGILACGHAPAKEFESLRGRLLFAENQVFGREANWAFKSVSKACRSSGHVRVNAPLQQSLEYLRDRVVMGLSREVNSGDRQIFHLYTDACHEAEGGGLGGMLYSCNGLLLRWFGEWREDLSAINPDGKAGLIYELEMIAALQGVARLCQSINYSNLILFCDNEGVVGSLICGKTDVPLAQRWINDILAFEASKDLCLWVERVPSASNPADAPSRMNLEGLPTSVRVRLSNLS